MTASQLLYELPVVGERTGMAAHKSDRDTGKMVLLFSQVTQNVGSSEKPVIHKTLREKKQKIGNFRKPLTF